MLSNQELRQALHRRLALLALACGLPVLAVLWATELGKAAPRAELLGFYPTLSLLCLWAVYWVSRGRPVDLLLRVIFTLNLLFILEQSYFGSAAVRHSAAQGNLNLYLMLIANVIIGYLIFNTRPAGIMALGVFVASFGLTVLSFALNGELRLLLFPAQLHLSTGAILLLVHALAWYKARFTTQYHEQRVLEYEASTDPLTGLPNRRSLYRQIEALLRNEERGDCGSVILFDIDHFKRVNDLYGHPTGDGALLHIAGLLTAFARPEDTPGRWGGEEFMLVLPHTPGEEAAALAELFRRQLSAAPYDVVGQITASFGVAACVPGDTLTRLTTRADSALYRAKQEGRDRVVLAGPDLMPDQTFLTA
jgi:diguanylate cyclase (GGDEF)-like protein